MSKKNFKLKINIIDAIVLVVIIALLGFAGFKLFYAAQSATETTDQKSSKETVTYAISYYCEEVPEYAANAIEVGAPITDETTTFDMGKVTKVEISDSTSFATDSDGVIHLSPKPLYHTVKLESLVKIPKEDAKFKFGMKLDGAYFGVGHTLTFRAGKAKLYGRISGIELLD